MTTTEILAPVPATPESEGPDRPRPRWARPALAVLLVGTAVTYLVNLSSQGWGNAFYAAAVQAGSVSWKAFLFGSSDAANSITVDKPPASLWVMEISVRIFGLNSWSVLAPQVLLGVASVAILYATVAKKFGPGAGLGAGLVLALTPTVALMFRYDNPDALLTFLMVAAAWAMVRALDDGRTRWLVLTGVFIGFGFIAKQLEVFLVLPGLALAYLLFGPPRLGRRLLQLIAAGVAVLVSAGWWVAIVVLTPAADRPWVGGSKTNSILDLTFGYNGFGRLTGNEGGGRGGGGGAPGAAAGAAQDGAQAAQGGAGAGGAAGAALPNAPQGGGGFGGFGGKTGITRLFADAQGGQIAWLIPAALLLAVAAIVLRGKAPRSDFKRGWYVMWGVWLVGAGVVFSYMSGTFHPYYTMTLAPAIAAIVAPAAVDLWRERTRLVARIVLAAALVLTVVTSFVFLDRTPDFVPWLRWVVLVGGILAAVAMLLPRLVGPVGSTLGRRGAVAVAVIAMLAALGGPISYVIQTVSTAHSGGGPTAGPSVPNAGGFGGGRGGGAGAQGQQGQQQAGQQQAGRQAADQQAGQQQPDQQQAGQQAVQGRGQQGGAQGGGFGGMQTSTPSEQVQALLEQNASSYKWVGATVGANAAAGYQLATQDPVMPIGGFSGSDPSPTLVQFQQDVTDGDVHWFIDGGQGGRGRQSDIATWVEQTYAPTTVDGVTLYDLTAAPVS